METNQSNAPTACAACGASLPPGALTCPRCGSAVVSVGASTPALAGTQTHTAPAAAASMTWQDEPTMPAEASQWPTTPATLPAPVAPYRAPSSPVGMATLAATPVAEAPVAHKSRRGWIASISAAIVVIVLGASAYGIYASFLRPSAQVQAAKDLPDTTLVYASVDLTAVANNSHHINFADLGKTASSTTGAVNPADSFGLNFQTDILPWLGPTATFAVIPGVSGGAMNEVALLQSHDDAAASAAVQKYLTAQQKSGTSYAASTYSGFTLHSAGAGGTTVATGAGWVIVASTSDGVHTVLDRMNGKGATLSGVASFQQATGSLPSGRFGTLYINLHALASSTSPGTGALSSAVLSVYPTAAGSLEWTSAGMRWQMTLQAAQGGFPQQNVSGDSTSLAALVPSNAVAYAGVANLGALTQSLAQLAAPTGQATPDPLKAALGIAASDPALQQPAALAVFAGSTGATPNGGAVLIHVASDADATRLLSALAQHSNWTTSATTVDGQAATQLIASDGGSTTAFGPIATGTTQTVSTPLVITQTTTRVVAVEAVVHNTMVLASSANDLQAVIETAKGSSGNLAQGADFHRLVSAAPTSAAASAYINVAGVQQLVHAPAGTALQTQTTAALLTLVWNNTELQTTIDAAFNQ